MATPVNNVAQTVAAGEVYRGTNCNYTLRAFSVTPTDLRSFFALLEVKAKEAADRQLATLTRPPDQSEENFNQLRTEVRDSLRLTVMVQAGNGHWIGGTSIDCLADEALPSGILQVMFDSSLAHRTKYSNTPLNSFSVALNFARCGVFDMNTQPTVVNSVVTITGSDLTWVSGVDSEISAFFRDRSTLRNWLHGTRTYDVLVVLVGFPLSFSVVYKLGTAIKAINSIPQPIIIAFYVYVVLVSLYLFRLTFNYAKWVYPSAELLAPRQNVAKRHKFVLGFLGLSLAGALVRTVLKVFGL